MFIVDLSITEEVKRNNWSWWDEEDFPAPDPAELARAFEYGDLYPFDKHIGEEWLKQDA
jgi:hypothetical protein